MSSGTSDSPATPALPKASEVIDWFFQGAKIGMFIGIAAGLIVTIANANSHRMSEMDYFVYPIGGFIFGICTWPILAALLFAVNGVQGPGATLIRCLCKTMVVLILVAFLGSVVFVLALKIGLDFSTPKPSPLPAHHYVHPTFSR